MKKRPDITAQTRENLETAFWQFYSTTPIEKISIGNVTQKAGYNRTTFYLYYTDIYDMLEQIEKRLLAGTQECVRTCMSTLDAGGVPEQAMQGVLTFYEKNRAYITVLLGAQGDPKFVEDLKTELKPLWAKYVLKRGDKADTGNKDTETDLVLEYTLSGALFMISKWLENPHGVTPEKLLHLIYHSAIER